MFNILDWYWFVGGDQTRVWSSKRLAYYPAADAIYQAWATQNVATAIGSADELVQVMIDQWLPAAAQRGLPVVCTSDNALSGIYGIDASKLFEITSIATGIAAGKPLPSGNNTFVYRDAANGTHVFNAESFTAFASAVESYVYNLREAITSLILGDAATLPAVPVTFA